MSTVPLIDEFLAIKNELGRQAYGAAYRAAQPEIGERALVSLLAKRLIEIEAQNASMLKRLKVYNLRVAKLIKAVFPNSSYYARKKAGLVRTQRRNPLPKAKA